MKIMLKFKKGIAKQYMGEKEDSWCCSVCKDEIDGVCDDCGERFKNKDVVYCNALDKGHYCQDCIDHYKIVSGETPK